MPGHPGATNESLELPTQPARKKKLRYPLMQRDAAMSESDLLVWRMLS
jgi:hypothetical protein